MLGLIPDLRAHSNGHDIVLVFDADVGKARDIVFEQADKEAFDLMRAAKIVLGDVLATQYLFDGNFEARCEKNVVPENL